MKLWPRGPITGARVLLLLVNNASFGSWKFSPRVSLYRLYYATATLFHFCRGGGGTPCSEYAPAPSPALLGLQLS